MNININNIQWGFSNGQSPPQDLFQQMLQICASHPACINCPYVGQPAQMGNEVQICENGINKKKENTQ